MPHLFEGSAEPDGCLDDALGGGVSAVALEDGIEHEYQGADQCGGGLGRCFLGPCEVFV